MKFKHTTYDMLSDFFTELLDSDKHFKFTYLIMNIKNKH